MMKSAATLYILMITFVILFSNQASARDCPDSSCASDANCGPDCCTSGCGKEYQCYKYVVDQNITDDGTSCDSGADCKPGATCTPLNECNKPFFTGYSACRSTTPASSADIAGCPATSTYIDPASFQNCYYWCPKKLEGSNVPSYNPCQDSLKPWKNKCNVGVQDTAIYECYDWDGSCNNVTGTGTSCSNKGDCSSEDCMGKVNAVVYDCVGNTCTYGIPSGSTESCVFPGNANSACTAKGHAGTTNRPLTYCWNCCKDTLCDDVVCNPYCLGNSLYSGVCDPLTGSCVYSSSSCGTSGCVGNTYVNKFCSVGACSQSMYVCDSRCDNSDPSAIISGAPASWQNTDAAGLVNCNDPDNCCNAASTGHLIYNSDPVTCPLVGYAVGNSFTATQHSWVCGYVQDNSGKAGVSIPVEFKIDKVQPDIICDDCYSPAEIVCGDDIRFLPVVNDTHSGISEVNICRDAGCTSIYCSNMDDAPPEIPVTRSCSYTTESCVYSEQDFYIRARDLAGNVKTMKGGSFVTLLGDGCSCVDSDKCESGQCIASVCLTPEKMDVSFSSGSLTVELGSKTQAPVYIKNNLPVKDVVNIKLQAYPEKMGYWAKFQNGDINVEVPLEANEDKLVLLDVFAGETGTYVITIVGTSSLIPSLYESSKISVQVKNSEEGASTSSPEFGWYAFLIILLISAFLLYNRGGPAIISKTLK